MAPSTEGFDDILFSVFDGIALETDSVNYDVSNISQNESSILMKTGFREPDEVRIVFRERPLRIRISPLNVHGFGAKISNIDNANGYQQGTCFMESIPSRESLHFLTFKAFRVFEFSEIQIVFAAFEHMLVKLTGNDLVISKTFH